MFAVPGWAVSADALAQQGAVTLVKSNTQKTQEQAFAESKSKSKKRKRTEGKQRASSKVSAEDLERLWNKQFSGKTAGDRSTKDKASRSSTVTTATPVEHEHGPTIDNAQSPQRQKSAASKSKSFSVNTQTITEQDTKRKAIRASQDGPDVESSRKGKKKNDMRKQDHQGREDVSKEELSKACPSSTAMTTPQPPPATTLSNLTPLQAKMRNKLTSARFRHLNQTLYTTSSSAALELFTTSPDLFAEYHAGFSQQVKDSWPQNPVDVYIRTIKTRGVIEESLDSLPRRKTGSCTIADLGCGDAPLARGCQAKIKDLKLKFHNFDLHAPNTHVTKADISNLPLRDGEADVAVFCLSLMGTNWLSFVEEAWRILRGDGKGELWVAEVKSRFGRVTRGKVVENSVGKKRKRQKTKMEDEDEAFAEVERPEQTADETDISAFVEVIQRRGFILKPETVSKGNKMFVSMTFVKSGVPTAGKHQGKKWFGKEYKIVHDGKMRFADDDEVLPEKEAKVLKPCVYKTR